MLDLLSLIYHEINNFYQIILSNFSPLSCSNTLLNDAFFVLTVLIEWGECYL